IYGDYRCEALFGEVLRQKPALRQQMQLITKCGIKLISSQRPEHRIKYYDTGREHIISSVEQSLRNFHTDYIDVLLIHRPDALMDADEVAATFTELRRQGKVLHFGVSNFTPAQFDLLQSRLDFPLVTNQIEFSVLAMSPAYDGTLDHLQQNRVLPMAWSPLGGGGLFHGQDERVQRVRSVLQQVGEELGGAPIDQVALAWIMTHPARILPVLGTGKIERIRSAAQASQLRLSREQWYMVWQASAGHEVP
ncbi:MAG: oxidoreductase, partial [Chloroflexi bacterium]